LHRKAAQYTVDEAADVEFQDDDDTSRKGSCGKQTGSRSLQHKADKYSNLNLNTFIIVQQRGKNICQERAITHVNSGAFRKESYGKLTGSHD